MNKGFIRTLFIASLSACAVASFAYAPVVRPLPDVTIGDKEDNVGATDNNWFVYTNAFQFDTFVSDQDTPVSSLKWSFDELGSSTPWYNINNIAAMHVGDSAIGTADGGTSDALHLSPGASDLRAASPYASFRDIVMSPPPGTGPFASQDPATITAHTDGRWIRFYVSDTNSVVEANCKVNIADNGNDKLSGGIPFILCQRDEMTTNNTTTNAAGTNGWFYNGLATAAQTGYANGVCGYDYDAANTALRGKVYSSQTATLADYRYRAAGWLCAEWLPFASAGTDKIVRAKYYMYSTPINPGDFTETGTYGATKVNSTPSWRCRVGQRYAYTQEIEITRPLGADDGMASWNDIKASTDPTKPSLYRADLWPTLVPAAQASGEGFIRGFEAFCVSNSCVPDQGYICMAESQIGVYPKSALTETVVKTYNPTDLYIYSTATEVNIFNYTYAGAPSPIPAGYFPTRETSIASELGTMTYDSTGFTIGSLGAPSTKIAVVARDFSADARSDTNPDYASRVRVNPGKQYRVSWHITSTRNSNVQAPLNLRARSAKFAYLSRLELGGPNGAGSINNNIAIQTAPGVGCQNPDKNSGDTTGGWYHQIMYTPLSADIRPEFAAGTALTTMMPKLATEQPTGSALPSQRDLRIGADIYDTMDSSGTYANEQGWYKIDQVVVREADAILDNIQ